jgi:hypothetical protein
VDQGFGAGGPKFPHSRADADQTAAWPRCRAGIDFSAEDRTFIHKIDSQIDMERSKVVNDLSLTAKVQSLLMIERPNVPRNGQNATGDNLTTDGKMPVLILK